MNEESGGIHWRGDSSIGKTTAVVVAGSAAGGRGINGYLTSWRATDNGLEAVAAAHCDLPLILDEIGQIDSRKVAEVAYILANGHGKQRARRDGSGRPAAEWRILFQSTGETSLADKVAETGGRATAGQQVRILDVPADAGAGHGCFENLHGGADGDAFSRQLRIAAAKYYGLPLRAFIRDLVLNRINHVDWMRKRRIEFEHQFDLSGIDGQVRRAIRRFSLIAAAGELASKLGITGWDEGEAAIGVTKCAQAWLAARGGNGPAEIEAAVRQVRKFIENHGESRFTNLDAPIEERTKTINRVGFRRAITNQAGTEYLVFPESFRSEVCKGFDATSVARELAARKFLLLDTEKKFSRAEYISVLDGTKRVYVLLSTILEEQAPAKEEVKS